jgi:hypothetical protein
MENIKNYNIILKEGDYIDAIALVENPAIKKDFQFFSSELELIEPVKGESKDEFIPKCVAYLIGEEGKDSDQAVAMCNSLWTDLNAEEKEEPQVKLSLSVDFDKKTISGAILLADTPVFRKGNTIINEPHYVTFPKETVKEIALKYAKKGTKLNLEHNSDDVISGLTMYESFITDSSRGIAPMKGYEDAPDGSWFGSFYIENPEVIKLTEEQIIKGFSIEGLFSYDI